MARWLAYIAVSIVAVGVIHLAAWACQAMAIIE